MKQAWCLAASSTDATAKQLTGLYGRRWAIECTLRDRKDLRFGMGLGTIRVKSPERRDRLWLINAFAVVLLTLVGAAGEALQRGWHHARTCGIPDGSLASGRLAAIGLFSQQNAMSALGHLPP